MSKRHQSNRRRSYGRRQHELRERASRYHAPDPSGLEFDEAGATTSNDPFAFMDPRLPRLRYGLGD